MNKSIEESTISSEKYKSDEEGSVKFGDVARGELDQTAQYASRYIDGGIPRYPNLGEGLRFKGDSRMYHDVRIHRDDIEEFAARYKKFVNGVLKNS